MVVATAGFGLAGCLFSVSTKNCGNDPALCSVPSTTSISGRVADGYVAFAAVTLDVNDDRLCEAGEPTTQTDASGNYSFSAALGVHMVCVTGGTDIATGLPLVGTLLAPPGATVVSPLTNLVMAQLNAATPPVAGVSSPVDQAGAFSAADALASQLGISGVGSLLTTDPVTNPALLQTTAAIQTMMVQTVSLLQATGGDDTDEAGSANTNELYADAATDLGSIVKALQIPLSGSNPGGLANALLSASTSSAQADPALAGLTGLTGISPASVAAFAGPTLAAMTNKVAGATTSSILSPGPNNIAALEQSNVALANTVADLAPLLLTSEADVAGQDLGSIATAALPANALGVPIAAASDITRQAVANTLDTSLPTSTVAALDMANVLNDITQVSAVRINCGTATCVPGPLLNNKPLVSTEVSNGPFTNVILSLAPPVGFAVKGGTPSTLEVSGAQPISGSEQDSSLSISVYSQVAGSPQHLALFLDHIVLYQTNALASGETPYTAIVGTVPATATLKVTGTRSDGTVLTATLNGAAAASVVQFGSLVSAASTTSDFKLDISALITSLGPLGGQIGLLSDVNNGEVGSGRRYVITTSFSGLKLSTLSPATPVRTNSFAVQVSF